MADEPDGVNEAWERSAGGATRLGVTAAGRLVEVGARARQHQAQGAEAAALHRAREMAARIDAERGAARALLAVTERPEWWARADPGDVAAAWEAARAWRDLDPDAGRPAERIREEVRTRYGVDPAQVGADPQALREALDAGAGAQEAARGERERSRAELVEAGALIAAADRADARDTPAPGRVAGGEAVEGANQARSTAGPAAEFGAAGRGGSRDAASAPAAALYDSAERRQDLAASLEGIGDEEAVQARVLADAHQGRPAEEAATAPRRAPKARARRARGDRSTEQYRTLSR